MECPNWLIDIPEEYYLIPEEDLNENEGEERKKLNRTIVNTTIESLDIEKGDLDQLREKRIKEKQKKPPVEYYDLTIEEDNIDTQTFPMKSRKGKQDKPIRIDIPKESKITDIESILTPVSRRDSVQSELDSINLNLSLLHGRLEGQTEEVV